MKWFATIVVAALTSPAAGAPDPAATKAGDAASDLRELGLRVQSDLERRFPGASGDVEHGDIAAIGPCRRASPDERDALTRLVTRGVQPEDVVRLAFGCKETSGIVVDVAVDKVDKDRRTGVWRVVRASAATSTATLTTLHEYEGTSIQNFMEWANEVNVFTQTLVDIDGDGMLDAVIGSDAHEGGSRRHDLTLMLWRSRDRRVVDLGTYDDSAGLAAGSRSAPFVIAAERMHADGSAESRYRCMSAEGIVDICPAVAQARHVGRMFEIASWFASGHEYEPAKSPLPDRELLTRLLTELEIPTAQQTHLVAEMPATTPQIHVARDIARFLAPSVPMKYGEIVDEVPLVDPRPAKLLALLGDAPCSVAPARVLTDVELWIRAHETDALVASGDCKLGKPCKLPTRTAPVISESCVDGARGYAVARWEYDNTAQNDRLGRAVVFSLAPALTPIATSTTHDMLNPCNACGPMSLGNSIDVELHRHDSQLIATIIDTTVTQDQTTSRTTSTYVDGARAPSPPAGVEWMQLRAPDATFPGMLQVPSRGGTTYLHFDGASWQPIVDVPWDPDAPRPLSLSPAARYVFDDAQRVYARLALTSFDLARWATDPATRATTHRQLVIAGASAAMVARVDAEAGAVSRH